MPDPADPPDGQPYPGAWADVAELRRFRTTVPKWASLIGWRAEMRRKGWKLLSVATESREIVAVFGRTRGDLKQREAPA
ncbi:MAG: hypothetical protein HYY94_04655 [Gemmatimonadetes bacterium]|nr:hypothetical protein [Gemmatimonadota bacterium]